MVACNTYFMAMKLILNAQTVEMADEYITETTDIESEAKHESSGRVLRSYFATEI